MKGSKKTMVLLEVPEHGLQRAFEFSHAERLLKMRDNGGWVLPKGSNFEMTENGLKYRTDTKGAEGK